MVQSHTLCWMGFDLDKKSLSSNPLLAANINEKSLPRKRERRGVKRECAASCKGV